MATPIKWGDEFTILSSNSDLPVGASITTMANGRFVASWTTTGAPSGAFFSDVSAQIFNGDGSPSGLAFQVNTTTTGYQGGGAVSGLDNGGFVITWDDTSRIGGDVDGSGIRAQVFDSAGAKSGADFLVNTTTDGYQSDGTVTTLKDGRFVVSWRDRSEITDENPNGSIDAQIFNQDGTKFGTEFRVNANKTGGGPHVEIAALTNGQFVVTWTGYDYSGRKTKIDVRARILDSDGTYSGPEFLVNTATVGHQLRSVITALSDGRFVISWEDSGKITNGTADYDIRAQVFNADGSKSGTEILVNTTTYNGQHDPTITALPDGRFVVSWSDYSLTGGDMDSSDIRAQVFNNDGTQSGDEFLVNTTTGGNQVSSAISALPDGRFVVSWQDLTYADWGTGIRSQYEDVSAQIFDPRTEAISLNGTPGADDFFGTIFSDDLSGSYGDDRLTGGDGDDTLFGQEGRDLLRGQSGNDRLVGGDGRDILKGGQGSDRLKGNAGNDTLKGGQGSDLLMGGKGNDILKGRRDDDILKGGAGNDRLSGGPGNDTLTGGRGADYFEFADGFGNDRITDFDKTKDRLDFSDNSGVNKLSDLTRKKVGADVHVTDGAGNVVIVEDTLRSDLGASVFDF